MCRVLREENSLLSFPAFGQSGNHRLGAGELSLRRKRRGCDRETEVRSLLYSSLFPQARRDDRAQDRARDAVQQGTLSSIARQTSDCQTSHVRGRKSEASGTGGPADEKVCTNRADKIPQRIWPCIRLRTSLR